MIGPSGIVELNPPHLSPDDYGYDLALIYSVAATPLMTRDFQFVLFIMVLNIVARHYIRLPMDAR